jgi:ABC-type arginine transport system ATPase subunit
MQDGALVEKGMANHVKNSKYESFQNYWIVR